MKLVEQAKALRRCACTDMRVGSLHVGFDCPGRELDDESESITPEEVELAFKVIASVLMQRPEVPPGTYD